MTSSATTGPVAARQSLPHRGWPVGEQLGYLWFTGGDVAYALDTGRERRIELFDASALGVGGRRRLLRAARRLTGCDHPNLAVPQRVGALGPWLILESDPPPPCCPGPVSLRRWAGASPRSAVELLARYRAAGLGLAAVHAVELAHGSFGPDRVELREDGRVVVVGLGWAELRELEDPRYRAPERWCGAGADARSDQFAWCAAVWEALFGAAPQLDARGGVRIPDSAPRGARPGGLAELGPWLIPLLRRGLAADPAERWPSITVLLAEIDRKLPGGDRAARRLGWLGWLGWLVWLVVSLIAAALAALLVCA